VKDLIRLEELRAATERNRFNFLHVELAFSLELLALAKSELKRGHQQGAERVLSEAEEGYATIQRCLPIVPNLEQAHEIRQKLIDLRTRLDSLAGKVLDGFDSYGSQLSRDAKKAREGFIAFQMLNNEEKR
jgi:hypothetical protein